MRLTLGTVWGKRNQNFSRTLCPDSCLVPANSVPQPVLEDSPFQGPKELVYPEQDVWG